MRVRLLGAVEVVEDDGSVVRVPGRKERALLAALALADGRTVPTDRLVDLLWGERPPASLEQSLRTLLSRLRALLGDRASVDRRGGGYVLTLADGDVDVGAAIRWREDATTAMAAGDATTAAALLRDAVALWTGPSLGDLRDDLGWSGEAARLDDLHLSLVEERVEADVAAGRHVEVVAELEHLCAEHPYRERLWRQRMVALYRAGRQADALQAYQDLRRLLADDLGLDPSPETVEVEARILAHDDVSPSASTPTPGAARLPTGVVTFLMTDIQGSTRLWEQHPDAMAAALDRHDLLATETVTGHGGVLLKARGEGDSTFSVFARSSGAVAAALDLQRALRSEPWPPDVALRVRVAIHAGEAELHDGDYRGRAVNRTARLRAVAHGGQTLLSGAVAAVAADDLPPDAELRRLGAIELADLDRPEEVFELRHPDVAEEFPPLKVRSVRRDNLPPPRTSFVGREAEVEEVRALLDDGRLVSLVGAGGAGKTRLATEVARTFVGTYVAGPWFVELAPVGPEQVDLTLATAIGLNDARATTAREAVVDNLGSASTLVILDNCEHVVAAAAELADELLRSCPTVRVLVTTREPLGVPGEVTYRVPSLPVPEPRASAAEVRSTPAGALFEERARAVAPRFSVDDATADAVGAICRRLDGIPLAIELASGLVRALPVTEIARRLDDRFRLLRGGGRTLLPRQQTLEALVDWSHQLLDERERLAWRRLSVFVGGFSLEAAEAVCCDDDLGPTEVLDLVFRLVDKSIVNTTDGLTAPRFRLNETIRLYGLSRLLDAGEAETFHDRHLDWAAGLADAAGPNLVRHDQRRWLDLLHDERDNLRAAISWAGPHRSALQLAIAANVWRYWEASGAWLEAADVLAAVTAEAAPSPLLVECLHGLGFIRQRLTRFDEAHDAFVLCGDVARTIGDRRGEGIALWGGEFARVWVDGPGDADALRSAVAIFREIDDQPMLARALFSLAVRHEHALEHTLAVECLRETIDVASRCGHLVMLGFALYNLGNRVSAPLEISLVEDAADAFRRSGNGYGLLLSVATLMELDALRGCTEASLRRFDEVRHTVWPMRFSDSISAVVDAAVALAVAGDPAAAADVLGVALPAVRAGRRMLLFDACAAAALATVLLGDDDWLVHAREALEHLVPLRRIDDLRITPLALALIHAGRPDAAADLVRATAEGTPLLGRTSPAAGWVLPGWSMVEDALGDAAAPEQRAHDLGSVAAAAARVLATLPA